MKPPTPQAPAAEENDSFCTLTVPPYSGVSLVQVSPTEWRIYINAPRSNQLPPHPRVKQ